MNRLGKKTLGDLGLVNPALVVLSSVAGLAFRGFFVWGLGRGSADSESAESSSISSAGRGGRSALRPSTWTPSGNVRDGAAGIGSLAPPAAGGSSSPVAGAGAGRAARVRVRGGSIGWEKFGTSSGMYRAGGKGLAVGGTGIGIKIAGGPIWAGAG